MKISLQNRAVLQCFAKKKKATKTNITVSWISTSSSSYEVLFSNEVCRFMKCNLRRVFQMQKAKNNNLQKFSFRDPANEIKCIYYKLQLQE